MTKAALSLQELWWPENTCFGCGPANEEGLQLRSFPTADGVVATWQPKRHHSAHPGVLCGGVIGTLLDCHTGAALSLALAQRVGNAAAPLAALPNPFAESPWATAEYTIQLLRPVSVEDTVTLMARVVALAEDQASIEAALEARGKICATCRARWKRLKRRYEDP